MIKNDEETLYMALRKKVHRFLKRQYLKCKATAILKSDKEKIAKFKISSEVIEALGANVSSCKCPLCEGNKIVFGYITNLQLKSPEKTYQEFIRNKKLSHCLDCGWYNIENW